MIKQPQFGFLVSAASGLVLLTAGIFSNNQSITIIGSALTTGNAILINQRQDDQDSNTNDNSPTQPLNPQDNPSLTTTKIPSGALAANKTDSKPTIPSQSPAQSKPLAQSQSQPKPKSTPTSQSKPPVQLKPKPIVKNKPIL